MVDWNISNVSQVFDWSLDAYFTILPQDAFFAVVIGVLLTGVYLASDYNLRMTFGALLLFDLFFSVLFISMVTFVLYIITAMIGAYLLYQSFYG